ncbi:hypothetical protein H0H81_010772 [Sphagnurus paluster]|uniref:Uncharacterized protein n=1 Tax=Sphagnurus paluster TaxID=117069 RepID=A0A9P7FSQ9_9AGAR|nr:hypothetical protein H0H81_010772 [Sphagnurus paluster]
MTKSEDKPIAFIPTLYRQPPPTKYLGKHDGHDMYRWYITEDEYLRLSKLFGRDFQEAGLGATIVRGVPAPCQDCGKYTEFIDWVWTALQRGVHSSDFMFKALKESRQGEEGAHDVYCSECGLLTIAQSNNKSEGGAKNIWLAGRLNRSAYPAKPRQSASTSRKAGDASKKVVVWGKWWLDNNGSTARYRASLRKNLSDV